MKTHRFTQLFLYGSGGVCSVKCVRQALEMETSKEELRGVIRFLMAKSASTRHKSTRPGMLSDGIILLHDNTRTHTDNLVRDKLQRFGWETQHLPYSPDLSPCDFHISGDLQKDIRGRRLHLDEEVQVWMRLWIHERPTSFYKTGIDRLISQCDKCIIVAAVITFPLGKL